MKKLLFMVGLVSLTLASDITATATATGDSKKSACSKAIDIAKEEALLEAGTNIFSTFSSTSSSNNDEYTEHIRQSSFGLATLKDKQEHFNMLDDGSIKCRVSAEFEVDTSRLKDELEAISAKHQAQKAINQAKIDSAKRLKTLTDKYDNLKSNLIKTHKFYYNGKQLCDEEVSVRDCTNKLKTKIKSKFLDSISDKYSVDSSKIESRFISFESDLDIKYSNALIISYSGDTKINISYISNPYIDEINELNVRLGNQPAKQYNKPQRYTPQSYNQSRYNRTQHKSKKSYDSWYLAISSGGVSISYSGLNEDGTLYYLLNNEFTNIIHSSNAIEISYLMPISKKTSYVLNINSSMDSFQRTDISASLSIDTTIYSLGLIKYSRSIGSGWFWQGGGGFATTSLSGDGVVSASNYGLGYYAGGGYAWDWGWGSNQLLINYTGTLKTNPVRSVQFYLVSLVF